MLNLREMPEAQNNFDRWGNGGGYFSVVTKGKKMTTYIRKCRTVVNVLTGIVAANLYAVFSFLRKEIAIIRFYTSVPLT